MGCYYGYPPFVLGIIVMHGMLLWIPSICFSCYSVMVMHGVLLWRQSICFRYYRTMVMHGVLLWRPSICFRCYYAMVMHGVLLLLLALLTLGVSMALVLIQSK